MNIPWLLFRGGWGMVGDKLNNIVTVQWIVDRDKSSNRGSRNMMARTREAVLCISLDYGKMFSLLANIIERNSGGFVLDDQPKYRLSWKIWRPVIFPHRKKPQKSWIV